MKTDLAPSAISAHVFGEADDLDFVSRILERLAVLFHVPGAMRYRDNRSPALSPDHAKGRTTVVEPIATRDHTELLLGHAGVDVQRKGLSVSVAAVERL